METTNLLDGAPIIADYSRSEAIKNGILIDVTETAKQIGIPIPTAVTRRVWDEVIVPPEAVGRLGSDLKSCLQPDSENEFLLEDAWDVLMRHRETGKKRLRDVLRAHRKEVRRSTLAPLQASVEYLVFMQNGHEDDIDHPQCSVTLMSTTSCEANFQPVLTILFSDEN